MKKATQESMTLNTLKNNKIMTTSELRRRGIHPETLARLTKRGVLERASRGVYHTATNDLTEHHGLAIVAAAIPAAVVCLLSALAYHEVGTQLPSRIWLALDRRARKPAMDYSPIEVVRFGGRSLTEGIEEHKIEGQTVRVYTIAKTVADCFKYRNKIGLDVAMEALREAWRARRVTMDELTHYARICRVERVMAPYLRALNG